MTEKPLFTLEDILPVLPHRPPFLFVDEVMALDPHKLIIARRLLRPDEPQFAGHFPGQPVMPGVLIAEALAQAAGLLIGLSERTAAAAPPNKPKEYVLAVTNIKFTRPAVPGDLLALQAASDLQFAALHLFKVEAAVNGDVVASGSLALALISNP
jgi:3-hydroxyacyl-[acyl-carrier-protein] dehydratase